MSVSPEKPSNWTSAIQFNDIIDKNKKQAVVFIDGMGGPTLLPEFRETTISKVNYHIVPYDSKNIMSQALNLLFDIKASKNRTISNQRRKRLNDLYEIIKERLIGKDRTNPIAVKDNYEEVILLGLSHGCLIIYSALLKLFADPEISLKHYEKLRFYAISPPFHFPPNILSSFIKYPLDYISKETHGNICQLAEDDIFNNEIKVDIDYRKYELNKKWIKLAPPFLQIHCENDEFFNTVKLQQSSSKIANGIINTLLKCARSCFLSQISEPFTAHLREINALKLKEELKDSNETFYVNQSKNFVMINTFPENKSDACLKKYIQDFIYKLYRNGYSWKAREMYRFAYLRPPYANTMTHGSPEKMFIVTCFSNDFTNFYRTSIRESIQQGGANNHIFLLGRKRKIYEKKMKSSVKYYIMYNKKLITLKKAQTLDQKHKLMSV
jgi:hypothetical protein